MRASGVSSTSTSAWLAAFGGGGGNDADPADKARARSSSRDSRRQDRGMAARNGPRAAVHARDRGGVQANAAAAGAWRCRDFVR